MAHIIVEPNERMQAFVWSPSKLAVMVGDLNWNNGCGVRLFLDHFAGPTYNIANNAFTFGTFVHELLEFYHAEDAAPQYETVVDWQKRYWIASEYKKDITKNFGETILAKLEHNIPVGLSDMRRDTPIDLNFLAGVYIKVDLLEHLLNNTATRWMFLGYGSADEEKAYIKRAQKIFKEYYKLPYVKPAGLESFMKIQFNGINVRGRIDRVDAIPAGYRVVDYKTSKKVKTPAELRRDFQMICYHIAATQQYNVPDEAVEVGLFFLAPEEKKQGVSTPKPMVMNTTKITRSIIEHATEVVMEADRRVKNGIFHYVASNGKWQCPWCSYYGACGRPED